MPRLREDIIDISRIETSVSPDSPDSSNKLQWGSSDNYILLFSYTTDYGICHKDVEHYGPLHIAFPSEESFRESRVFKEDYEEYLDLLEWFVAAVFIPMFKHLVALHQLGVTLCSQDIIGYSLFVESVVHTSDRVNVDDMLKAIKTAAESGRYPWEKA